MKTLHYWVIYFFAIAVVVYILLNMLFLSIEKSEHLPNVAFFSTDIADGLERKTIVAIYEVDGKLISLERTLVVEKYNCLFYASMNYSDSYKINTDNIEKKYDFATRIKMKHNIPHCVVLEGNETLSCRYRKPIYHIPLQLTLYKPNDNTKYDVALVKVIVENIEHKPYIPLSEKLNWGP